MPVVSNGMHATAKARDVSTACSTHNTAVISKHAITANTDLKRDSPDGLCWSAARLSSGGACDVVPRLLLLLLLDARPARAPEHSPAKQSAGKSS